MIQFRSDDREKQRPIRRVGDTGVAAYVFDDLPDVESSSKKSKKTTSNLRILAFFANFFQNLQTATKSPTTASKKKATATKDDSADASWQWKNDDGDWCDYAREDSELIERFYASGVKTVTTDKLSFSASYGTEYELNFASMTQKNLESNKLRNIRRNSGDSMKDDRQTSSAATTTSTTSSTKATNSSNNRNRNIPLESEMVYYNETSVSNRSSRKVSRSFRAVFGFLLPY
jgi:hypothetical protein